MISYRVYAWKRIITVIAKHIPSYIKRIVPDIIDIAFSGDRDYDDNPYSWNYFAYEVINAAFDILMTLARTKGSCF